MRTTVNIGDDVLTAARALAEARGIPLGEAITILARRGLRSGEGIERAEGFPVFRVPAGSRIFGPEDVAAAEDEEDEGRDRGLRSGA